MPSIHDYMAQEDMADLYAMHMDDQCEKEGYCVACWGHGHVAHYPWWHPPMLAACAPCGGTGKQAHRGVPSDD
jgi:hypothetical protein